MPTTLELCEQYYGIKDIYVLFEIEKDALEKDIKKAYYKLSLRVHPDRVPEAQKEIATEKFKILGKLYSVLTDKDKKALYDEKGIIDDDDDDSKLSSWLEMWKLFFKPITDEDIDNYQKTYIGSDLEKADIKRSYLNGKGCINYMMGCVPFMNVEDEPRIIEYVKELIASGEVPEYKIFTEEPKSKRDKRHRKYARELKEAEKIEAKLAKDNKESLEQQITRKQNERYGEVDSFLNKLMEKYGKEDKSKPMKIKKKKKVPPVTAKKERVKKGKITKNKK